MKTVFKNINTLDIINFQEAFEITLPEDYKSFLLESNGGFPSFNRFVFYETFEQGSCEILFSLDDNSTSYKHLTLEANFRDLAKIMSMPDEIFPIGQDGGGNYVCICLKGPHYGRIYFWDHEKENEDEEGNITWNNLTLIAKNFTIFFNTLF